jgi:hypothetical protein
MKKRTEKSMLEAGLYLSHMNYYATGEGVRSCLAIGGSREHAERLMKEKLPNYFHALIVTGPATVNASQDILEMVKWLPTEIRNALAEMPLGAAEYYSEFHYNLA